MKAAGDPTASASDTSSELPAHRRRRTKTQRQESHQPAAPEARTDQCRRRIRWLAAIDSKARRSVMLSISEIFSSQERWITHSASNDEECIRLKLTSGCLHCRTATINVAADAVSTFRLHESRSCPAKGMEAKARPESSRIVTMANKEVKCRHLSAHFYSKSKFRRHVISLRGLTDDECWNWCKSQHGSFQRFAGSRGSPVVPSPEAAKTPPGSMAMTTEQ